MKNFANEEDVDGVRIILDAIESRIKEPEPGDLVTNLTGERVAVLVAKDGYVEQSFNPTGSFWRARTVRVPCWRALQDARLELLIREDHMKVVR